MKPRVITFGEIMLRLSPPSFQRLSQARSFELAFGGAEANVAVSLAQFGVSASYVTRLPHNPLAEGCLQFLRQYGVETADIVWGGSRVGIYFMERGAAQRGGEVIYDRATSALTTIEPGMVDWEAILSKGDWFHWTGITPAVSEGAAAACREAVETARRLGLTISCDLNYRSRLWKWGRHPKQVMPDLVRACDLLIGSPWTAHQMLGCHGLEEEAKDDGMAAHRAFFEELGRQFPRIGLIAVTLREPLSASHNTWSGLLWDGQTMFRAATYDIFPIVDRIGAGDAFTAGLIFSLLRNDAGKQRAIDFAVAASCLKHTVEGDVNQVSVEEVERLMETDAAGRMRR